MLRLGRSLRLLALLTVCAAASACKKESSPPPPNPVLAPNAPVDKPLDTRGEAAAEALRIAEAPYRQKARETYPDAKRRFLAGLPAGHAFFAVTQLHDGPVTEQVFVSVATIRDGQISGRIASDIQAVKGFKRSDPHSFPESELVDWLISRPDGSEEGNFVGKFLDERQSPKPTP